MTTINWILGLFPVVLVALSLKFKGILNQKAVGTILFIYFLASCTFGFDVIVREVAFQAQKNGTASEDFISGLVALNEAVLKIRLLLGIIGSCMLLLIVFPVTHREVVDKEKSG